MAEFLRCRACGYIVEASRVKAVCPACGAARKGMEAWKDPVDRGRRLLLSLDIHPIIIHFSMAFICSALVLALVSLAFPATYPQTVAGLLVIFTAVLPVAVLAAFLSGLLDARGRFRRVTTPALARKIVFGGVLFCVTCAAAFLTLSVGTEVPWALAAVTGLLACGVVCAAVLGRIGKGLLAALLPG
jgi:uncharacterized membrane protein